MPGKPTVLTEAAFRELRREIHTARQEISNLRRHLAHVSTRRHEAVWMPAAIQTDYRYVAQATVISITATTLTQIDLTSASDFPDENNFSLASGIVTSVNGGVYQIHLSFANMAIPYVRNAALAVSLGIQVRDDDSDPSWNTLTGYEQRDTMHPDLAVGSPQTNTYSGGFVHPLAFITAGNQFRVVYDTGADGSYGTPNGSLGTLVLTFVKSPGSDTFTV